MKRSMIGVVGVLAVLLAAGAAARAEVLWGCTNGTGDAGFWTGGEIFKVDTATGGVTVVKTYTLGDDGIYAFGDIARTPNRNLYVTIWNTVSWDFTTLGKVNPSTGAIETTRNIGTAGADGSGAQCQINSLHGVSDTLLYGIEGGGVSNADLVKINLDAGGNYVSRIDLGAVGNAADGDLADDPTTGTWYGTFWSATGSTLDTITISPPGSTMGPNTGISSGGGSLAGLEFTTDGTSYTDGTSAALWAGSYNDQKLYTINSLITGGNTMRHDLSASLGGTITGPTVPEPATMLLVGAALTGLAASRRRKVRC